jgi:exonuclease SbcC
MIESLEIENFQAHKYSVIEFHPGVNVITGTSDVGKSSILRALRWVIYNRPNGDDFKNWHCKKSDSVMVSVTFNDGYVAKERNKTNVYHLEEKDLEAVRSDIPEELQEITKMVDYNIQTQHQPYFLLQDSPGDVAKHLNKLIGLDVIDRVFKNINSYVMETTKNIGRLNNQRKEIEHELGKLEYLDSFASQLNTLEAEVEQLETNRQRANLLRNIVNQIADLIEAEAEEKEILKLEPICQEFKQLFEGMNETNNIITVLTRILDNFEYTQTKIREVSEILIIEEPIKTIKNMILDYDVMDQKAESLDNFIGAITKTNNKIQEYRSSLKDDVVKYVDLLKENKECPTCKGKINNQIIKELERKLLN